MRKPMENGDNRGSHGQAYKDKSKPADIRSSNINAAKGRIIRFANGAFSDYVETCSRSWINYGGHLSVKLRKMLPYIAMGAFEPAKQLACSSSKCIKKLLAANLAAWHASLLSDYLIFYIDCLFAF